MSEKRNPRYLSVGRFDRSPLVGARVIGPSVYQFASSVGKTVWSCSCGCGGLVEIGEYAIDNKGFAFQYGHSLDGKGEFKAYPPRKRREKSTEPKWDEITAELEIEVKTEGICTCSEKSGLVCQPCKGARK